MLPTYPSHGKSICSAKLTQCLAIYKSSCSRYVSVFLTSSSWKKDESPRELSESFLWIKLCDVPEMYSKIMPEGSRDNPKNGGPSSCFSVSPNLSGLICSFRRLVGPPVIKIPGNRYRFTAAPKRQILSAQMIRSTTVSWVSLATLRTICREFEHVKYTFYDII